jgi:hypothetical protein
MLASTTRTAPECRFSATPWVSQDRRRLRRLVGDALQRGERRIIVDCQSWLQPDVVLLATLVRCANLSAENGACLELANLDQSMRHALCELNLAKRFCISE